MSQALIELYIYKLIYFSHHLCGGHYYSEMKKLGLRDVNSTVELRSWEMLQKSCLFMTKKVEA